MENTKIISHEKFVNFRNNTKRIEALKAQCVEKVFILNKLLRKSIELNLPDEEIRMEDFKKIYTTVSEVRQSDTKHSRAELLAILKEIRNEILLLKVEMEKE